MTMTHAPVSDEAVEARRKFVNELGHEISIEINRVSQDGMRLVISGPDSTAESILTNREFSELRDALAAAPFMRGDGEAIDMILFCPACGLQHIDAPDERTPEWTNPPHRSHLCHGCGHIWRPADVPTNGVAEIKTLGSNDKTPPLREASWVNPTIIANHRGEVRKAALEEAAKIADEEAGDWILVGKSACNLVAKRIRALAAQDAPGKG